jgi:hypothetical protein
MTQLLHEPRNNAYGRYRVYARTDGRFVVHDPQEWPPAGAVFQSEADARGEAMDRARADNPKYVHPPEDVSVDDLRTWMARQPHTAWCLCARCAAARSAAAPR